MPVAQSRTSTPKHTTNTAGSGGIRSAKVRGSSDKENGSDAGHVRPARRRSSVLAMREKLPSKDGTAQRHAKEVEGLKDYVRGPLSVSQMVQSARPSLKWRSDVEDITIRRNIVSAIIVLASWQPL